MKNSMVITVGILLLLGCSSTTTQKSICQPLKDELHSLKFEHRMEQGAKVANILMLRNQYTKEEGHLDQRVKVLEIRLRECERRLK